MDDFCMFCGREWNAVVVCITLCWFHLSHLRPNGLPTGVQVQSQKSVACDANRWSNLMPHFVNFCAQARRRSEGHCSVQSVALFFHFHLCPPRAACGHTGFTSLLFYTLETETVWSHRHPDRLFRPKASQYPTAWPSHLRCWIPKRGAVGSGASIWSLLVKPVAWNPIWMECSSATNLRIQTPQILGADCVVSSLETGGLHCEPSAQFLGKTSIRMATACAKGGQGWAGDQTHGSQRLRNLQGGSGGTTGKTLPCATLRCGSNQCLSLCKFAVSR